MQVSEELEWVQGTSSTQLNPARDSNSGTDSGLGLGDWTWLKPCTRRGMQVACPTPHTDNVIIVYEVGNIKLGDSMWKQCATV